MKSQAAQAMSAYTGWVPQEFDEAALDATASVQDGAPAGSGSRQVEAGPSNMSESEFQYDSTSGAPPRDFSRDF